MVGINHTALRKYDLNVTIEQQKREMVFDISSRQITKNNEIALSALGLVEFIYPEEFPLKIEEYVEPGVIQSAIEFGQRP